MMYMFVCMHAFVFVCGSCGLSAAHCWIWYVDDEAFASHWFSSN